MESQRIIREAVGRGPKSKGFMFYLADHPDDEKLWSSGQQDAAYRHFLEWLGGSLAEEIGVLFSPEDSANRLFPPHKVLEKVLDLINSEELKDVWPEDETIGWIYQYFTPKELRDQARRESHAPRNSYELAFRNQFYTPRYVVEFLTDNTLGRTWYEMQKAETGLEKKCRYLVRRPNEIFLSPEEKAPEAKGGSSKISNEAVLQQPFCIHHRPKKDPRDIKVLDPACGSGHFLLYCFDLLELIYHEAYEDPELGPALKKDYPSEQDFRKAVPALILSRNLYGVDIDLRATQIAALALWLRAQKTYRQLELKDSKGPKITRSNIVCAEPMPGEKDLLEELVSELQPRVLGQLIKVVFDKMELAGEAGSLLKIEDEIRDTIADAKNQWSTSPRGEQLTLWPQLKQSGPQQLNTYDVSGITEEEFWSRAESLVFKALREYASRVSNGKELLRKLFADDAVRGFSFIDLCRKRFDVVLMNPPFGDASIPSKPYIEETYADTKGDVYKAFVECFQSRLVPAGYLGIISNRTGFFLSQSSDWRERIVLRLYRPLVLADLGYGVLDAMVETAAYVLRNLSIEEDRNLTLELLPDLLDVDTDREGAFSIPKYQNSEKGLSGTRRAGIGAAAGRWFCDGTFRRICSFCPQYPRHSKCAETAKHFLPEPHLLSLDWK